MNFAAHHFCKKCRTCNTLTSSQRDAADATSGHESAVGSCLGSGDASKKDQLEEKTIIEEFSPMNLACPPSGQIFSSSGTPNTVQTDSSTPRCDDRSNDSDARKEPVLPNDSLLLYLQHEQEANPNPISSQYPLHDRNVVGQEMSPMPGIPSEASASTASSQGRTSESAPKERRRWVRPPLIGQAASSTEVKLISDDFQPSGEEDSLIDDSGSKMNESSIRDCSVASSEISVLNHEKLKSSSSNEMANNSSLSKSIETSDSTDENLPQTSFQTSVDGEQGILSDSYMGGKASPSSSVASHKRLEWDSGADVGYRDYQSGAEGSRTSKLSAIERLALIQNTDKALRMRLDPEGISASVPSTGNNPTPTFNTYRLSLQHTIGQPSAESTPIERANVLNDQRKSDSIGISPITIVDSHKQVSSKNNPVQECKDTEESEDFTPRPRSSSASRTRSASLLNLPTAVTDRSNYLYLYRSHSDPDVSADDSFVRKYSLMKTSKEKDVDTHSLSTGSENTLVHALTEKRENEASDNILRHEAKEQTALNTHKLPQTFGLNSKGYSCSDNDHRHGLHHHYGILCSSSLVIPSVLAPQNPARTYNPPESSSSSVNFSGSSTSHSVQSESGNIGQHIKRKSLSQENVATQDRATSVTPPEDETRGDTPPCVVKATSIEYLPGCLYESKMAAMRSCLRAQVQLSQPPSSDSSSVNSGQNSAKHHVVRHSKHKPVMTSSGDSEDALWSSPQISSGTLVRDLERGVSLLRGLVPQNVHNRAAQRELVRRVVQRLLSTEYTDDLLEKKIRRQNRRPLSGGQPTSLSDRAETEQRARSAPHRSSRKVQSSGSLRAPTKTYVDTCTQPSDTVSSTATDSSSLRSTPTNDTQKSAKETTNSRNMQQPNDKQPENLPANQPSIAVEGQRSNASSGPSNLASGQPSNPASGQASSHSSNQRSNPSSQAGSLPKAPSVVNVAPVTNPATTDASTATSHEMRTAVSYGTLSSVVSITPNVITVQSSPAVPMREVKSEIPTATVATMTCPPPYIAEPSISAGEPPATSSLPVPDVREVQGTNEERRRRKTASSQNRQQIQLINCEISHLKNIEKMLKKHPPILISSPVDLPAPSNPSVSRKAKVADCPTSEEHLEHQRRPCRRSRNQDDYTERVSSTLRKCAPSLPSADSNSTITSSVLSSATSASNSAPDCYACIAGSAPVTTSREATEENNRLNRKQREPSPESEDSVTRAVTQAVSSRVKALRNLGQIEEAEVKIRVRMGQPSDAEGQQGARPIIDPTPKISISKPRPSRHVENDDFDSKRAELDELIARQRAMDAEARKKLQLLNEMRENALRRATDLKTKTVQQRDACTLTSVDNATNTTPLSSATHVVSRSTQMMKAPVESSSSSTQPESSPKQSSCPACRVRASSRKLPENEPMCRHDPGFTAGQPRGRQRPPTAYFLKLEEEEVFVRPQTPPRVPTLQVVTVKVPRSIRRPPSSIGSSGSLSSGSTSSRHSPAQSPMMSPKAKGHVASSVPAFGYDSRSFPEPQKKRTSRKPAGREVATSRSEPQLDRGDADKYAPEYSSDEETATGTLQDCLTSNFPEYIEAAERRRKCIHEMSYLRRLRQQSRKRLVQLDGESWVTRQKQARTQKPSTAPVKPARKPKLSARSMRESAAKKFARMPEIEQKKLEMKKKEENRTNRLLKEIYTTKLREKALRGETTLRSSVSVISSF